MHDMHRVWFRRSRLAEKAIILQAMDKAIVKEGGVESLSTEALKHACHIRGNEIVRKTYDFPFLICEIAHILKL